MNEATPPDIQGSHESNHKQALIALFLVIQTVKLQKV